MTTDYSRSLRLASTSSTTTTDAVRTQVEATIVVVTVDATAPQASLTAAILLENLRRLPVQLHLAAAAGITPLPTETVDRITHRLAEIDPGRPLHHGMPAKKTIHLHLGNDPGVADITATADGHGVRLRRRGRAFASLAGIATGLGAVVTAATLTGEAFKTIVPVASNRHRIVDALDFCPVTLATPGLPAPVPWLDQASLIGCGAIGTAIALILRALGVSGSLVVIDPEIFDEPNVTTYSLGGRADAARKLAKVDLLVRALPGIAVRPLRGTARDLITAIDDKTVPMPRVVFGGVDSVDARHEIAGLHADLTLDGSTGGQTGTRVALAEATATGPCLRCYYPVAPVTTVTVEQRLAELTGLPLARIAAGDALTQADLAEIEPQQRALLAGHVGKPICGLGRTLGLTGVTSEYAPSAAFVAQQAAALVVGAWIRRATESELAVRDVEYDALYGPDAGAVQPRRARPGCRCQTDAALIARVRQGRWP
jgi:molybdopterin/thiamine biosynthesis adenylyltransferase